MSHFTLNNRVLPFTKLSGESLPVWAITPKDLESGLVDEVATAWAKATQFDASAGSLALVPKSDGSLSGALFGLGADPDNPLLAGKLARHLPKGNWHIETAHLDPLQMSLGFGFGAYEFDKYKTSNRQKPNLTMDEGDAQNDVTRQISGAYLAKDLINTPTNDMGPDALEDAFHALAKFYGAKVMVTKGDDLLKQNFPMIHTVGRASHQAPRLLDMVWGKDSDPKITLVGKGVCFDTGGLNLKPGNSMALMKKDMGGAANVLGLALMIMDAKLPVRLRVLIPAVENSISDNAFRPSDVLISRKGLSVQIDNTDAEGRLVLADALSYASEENPELMIDMATLTGAARVALGPDVPPFFTDDEALAQSLYQHSVDTRDHLWRLPLFKGYEADLKTQIADLSNAPSGGFAGSITAALFLKRFVGEDIPWIHFDIYGWNPKEKPHSIKGGEAQAIRAIYAMFKEKYGA